MFVVVTGANGLVGANLVRMLVARGDRVKALVYGDTKSLAGLDIEIAECRLFDRTAMCAAMEGIEVVFHLASVITLLSNSNPLAERINEEGARNVAEACLECGVKRLVHFSSIHALSPEPRNEAVIESRPLCGTDHPFPYDRSKAAGQRAVLEVGRRGLDVVVIHPTGIIGPYDFAPSMAGKGLLDVCSGRARVLVEGGFDWVDVRDVCTGTLAAVDKGRRDENYILSGNYVTVADMGRAVLELTGCRAPLMIAPRWLAGLAAPCLETWAKLHRQEPRFSKFTLHTLASHQQVSHEKASRELGYKPRPFLETIRDTLEWFGQAGMTRLPSSG